MMMHQLCKRPFHHYLRLCLSFLFLFFLGGGGWGLESDGSHEDEFVVNSSTSTLSLDGVIRREWKEFG